MLSLVVLFGAALAMTGIVIRASTILGFIDVSNERSSHEGIVPRSGGVGFVVPFSFFVLVQVWQGVFDWRLAATVILPALVVAAIGLLDDRAGVPVKIRLGVHLAAAVSVLASLSGPVVLEVFGTNVSAAWLVLPLLLLYLVWMLNLYNFMDGIDGLAGSQAAAVSVIVGLILLDLGHSAESGLMLGLCSCILGFLIWNWAPARIFMGDVGSVYLGFLFGALSIFLHTSGHLEFWVWPILLGVFVVDATTTLLVRLFSGYKVYEPHRSHAYQNASRYLRSHALVGVVVVLINVFWLAPIACAVAKNWLDGAAGVVLAYVPLLILAVRMKAGKRGVREP